VNFIESEKYLLSLGNEVSAMKLGLENIEKLLAALGNPEKNYIKVQVAGTNGKGSVCAFLNSICLQAGIKTGMYTSPHLVSITERVQINGVDIGEDEFARLATHVRETAERLLTDGVLEYRPTFFEQVTAVALVAFAEAKVELAILETGLGGRLDATTAANAEIAAITRIDYDHQNYLGDTIEEIAAEKAAIISEETRGVVIGAQSRNVMAILRKRCSEFGIEPINDEYEPWGVLPAEGDNVHVILSLIRWPPIRLGLKGRHQIENAQTAVQIAKALLYQSVFSDFGEDLEIRIVEGLENARHPGRLEYIGDHYLLDGAHNVGGAKALADFLDEFEARPVTIIYGTMQDKDVGEIAKILFPKAANLILTTPDNSRAMPADELLKFAGERDVHISETTSAAIDLANGLVGDGIILVTGSLYLVGEIKGIINKKLDKA
jgi:dihydrofolate synthase/folylpolyglutamate synthase